MTIEHRFYFVRIVHTPTQVANVLVMVDAHYQRFAHVAAFSDQRVSIQSLMLSQLHTIVFTPTTFVRSPV
jgi:hypothetical protein